MPLLSLNLQSRFPVRVERDLRSVRLRVRFDNLGRGLLPGRGLLYSFLTHELVVVILIFWPAYPARPPRSQPVDQSADSYQVTYLPHLGGGSEGDGYQGGGSVIHRRGAAVDLTRATKGVSYPGPQPILSDSPKPTNRIQTILRPAVKNPTVLRSFVTAPNIVQLANSVSIPSVSAEPARPLPRLGPLNPKAPTPTDVKSSPVPDVQPAFTVALTVADDPQLARPRPQFSQLRPKTPVQNDTSSPEPLPIIPASTTPPPQARLTLPTTDSPKRPSLPQMGAPKRIPSKADELQATPLVSPLQAQGTALETLLSISPIPAQPANIPPGESRGRFAISPEPSVVSSEIEPGSKTDEPRTQTVGVGGVAEVAPGNAAAAGSIGTRDGMVRLAIGGAGGLGTNTGSETGAGNGGAGFDKGRGAAAGARLGEGPRGSAGGGTGAGAGKNGGPFLGITIQGGTLQGGNGGTPVSSTISTVAPKSSYGMTIVSTASSGGGLPDFGVFSHEQVYSVYLDMRRTVEDPAPTWTLQCALLQSTDAQDTGTTSQNLTSGFVPPFPVVKEQPDLPLDLIRRYLGRLIVIYGIVDASGRFKQMSVKQSPDSRFSGPVLEQLGKWVFRPAELNGVPVAVRVLLGFSLSLPEQYEGKK